MQESIMKKLFGILMSAAVLATLLLSSTANAYEEGDWLLRVGVGNVDPKSSNGEVVSVDSGTAVVFNGTYFFTPNLGFEILAATPFSHDIHAVDGGSKLAETKHLPPTFSLNYHFDTAGSFKPYVGAGLNYTLFFDEETTGDLSDFSLSLDKSLGLAAQLGADIDVSDTMFVNLNVRWIDINTDAKLDGVFVEEVEIDPIVFSLALGWKF
jgi:outer membrane protein